MLQREIKRQKIYYIFTEEYEDISPHVYEVYCVSANYKKELGWYPTNRFRVKAVLFGDDRAYKIGDEFHLISTKESLAFVYHTDKEPIRMAFTRTNSLIKKYKEEIKRLKELL